MGFSWDLDAMLEVGGLADPVTFIQMSNRLVLMHLRFYR